MRKGPEHKAAVRRRVGDYVLRHGLADLSLRPLGEAVGLSPRVLLYHFGSKEGMVAEALEDVRERNLAAFVTRSGGPGESPGEAFLRLWRMLARPENGPYLRLFFHVYGLALQDPGRYQAFTGRVVSDWLAALAERFSADAELATLALAGVRGLLLDMLTTEDAGRTDKAAEAFAALLDRRLVSTDTTKENACV